MTEAEFLNVMSQAISAACRKSGRAWGHLPLVRRIIREIAGLIFDPQLEHNGMKQLRDAERTLAALSEYLYLVSEALREFREE